MRRLPSLASRASSFAFSIKASLSNVSLHPLREEIPDRPSPFNRFPDPGRRDIEKRDFLQIEAVSGHMDPSVGGRIVPENRDQTLRKLENILSLLRTRPGHHDKMAQGEEFLKMPPCPDLEKGVSPEDKEKRAAVNLLEITDRVDGVGLPAPLQFNIRCRKRGIGPYGKPDHIETMRRIRHPRRFLVGRGRRGNEDHLLEIKGLPDLLCPPEMSQMDGIKSPAEKTLSSFHAFCFDP